MTDRPARRPAKPRGQREEWGDASWSHVGAMADSMNVHRRRASGLASSTSSVLHRRESRGVIQERRVPAC